MAICEKCGCQFDEWLAEDEFINGVSSEFHVNYYNLNKCLCGDCAIEEFENGNYFETCENCGKSFYPEDEKHDFDRQVSYRIDGADMFEHGILCANCAAEKLLGLLEEEDDVNEKLSVYDAALIWMSNGRDEDYMFGYSEDELKEALGE